MNRKHKNDWRKVSGSVWLDERVNSRYLQEVMLKREVRAYYEGSQERTDEREEKKCSWFSDTIKGTIFLQPKNSLKENNYSMNTLKKNNAKFNSQIGMASKLSYTPRFRFSLPPSSSPQKNP